MGSPLRVVLLCGPKGAGKTTALRRMEALAPSRVRYIPSEALFLRARDVLRTDEIVANSRDAGAKYSRGASEELAKGLSGLFDRS